MDYINEFELQVNNILENGNKSKNKYQDVDVLNIPEKAKIILKDLDENHNYSFAMNAYLRNKKNFSRNAIFYRGNKIDYRSLFNHVFSYAKSLKELGYKKGDEVPLCVSNTPEFVYLYLAINLIGGVVNSFGEWFDSDYLKMIIEKSKSDYVFISDDVYDALKDKLNDINFNNLVIVPLSNSLPIFRGENVDPYEEFDKGYADFKDKTDCIKENTSKNVIAINDFENIGVDYDGKVVEDVELDDPMAVTYTSGTTNPGVPKGVLHANRSYVTISRFHDKDISGLASMDGISVLHHIPTYTHMELCSLGDSLFHGCLMNLEPIYNRCFFKYSMVIHRPNYAPGSVGFYLDFCNNLNNNPKFKNLDFTNLIAPTITGEGMSGGEEKYFNYTARKHKFGTSKLPFPLAPVSFSIGGGTGEASGIFTTLFKAHLEKLPQNMFLKEGIGLTTLPFAETEVLDNNGRYCKLNEVGLLVGKSPADMTKYYYDENDFDKLHINDLHVESADGKRWLSLTNYAFKSDNNRRVRIKGRLDDAFVVNGRTIPLFEIEDVVLKDTKNVMSTTAVRVNDDKMGESIVIHVEFSPVMISGFAKALDSINARLKKEFPKELLDKMYIRVHSNVESFPIAPSGKRNRGALIDEGLDLTKCFEVIPKFITNKNVKKLEYK